jgi:hypothetical protein
MAVSKDGRNHHEHEKIVELARVPSRFEADTIVAKLHANGIDASAQHNDAAGVAPHYGLLEGHIVVVFENDLARARQLVAEE